jgi:hypothetical protein
MLMDTSENNTLSIKKTYLAYYNLGLSYTSALGYYEESLDAIVHAMKVNLELEEEEEITTFEISYSEDYTTPLIGYGISGKREETVPSFIGYDSYYVDNWCRNNSVSCYFERVDSDKENGQILTQSVSGELISSTSSISFSVSNGSLKKTQPETVITPTEKKEEIKPKKEITPEPVEEEKKEVVEEPKEEPVEEPKKEEPKEDTQTTPSTTPTPTPTPTPSPTPSPEQNTGE